MWQYLFSVRHACLVLSTSDWCLLTLLFFFQSTLVWLACLYFLSGYYTIGILLYQFEWQIFAVYEDYSIEFSPFGLIKKECFNFYMVRLCTTKSSYQVRITITISTSFVFGKIKEKYFVIYLIFESPSFVPNLPFIITMENFIYSLQLLQRSKKDEMLSNDRDFKLPRQSPKIPM